MHREMEWLAGASGCPKGTSIIDWLIEKGLLEEASPDVYEFSPKALALLKCQNGKEISESAAEVRNAESADAQVRMPLITEMTPDEIEEMTPDEIEAEFERVYAGMMLGEISMSEIIEHALAWNRKLNSCSKSTH